VKTYQKVIAFFKEMGFKPQVDDFQDRLLVQKITYLLERKGVLKGYQFKLHLRGPYCQPLTNDLYNHRKEFEKLDTSTKLTEKERQAVDELHEIFDLSPTLLEVAATYAFFAYEKGETALEATRKTRKIKKNASPAQLALGMNRAKRYLYTPTKEELKSLRQEMAAFDRASIQDLQKTLKRLEK